MSGTEPAVACLNRLANDFTVPCSRCWWPCACSVPACNGECDLKLATTRRGPAAENKSRHGVLIAGRGCLAHRRSDIFGSCPGIYFEEAKRPRGSPHVATPLPAPSTPAVQRIPWIRSSICSKSATALDKEARYVCLACGSTLRACRR